MHGKQPKLTPQHDPRSYTAFAAVAVVLLLASGCVGKEAPASVDTFAREYLALALALGEHDPDSLDFYFGPPALAATAHQRPLKLDAIRQQASSLQEQLRRLQPASPQEASRAAFLADQLDAIALRAGLLEGKNLAFDEESRIFFGVVADADRDAASRAQTRSQLAALLGHGAAPARAYADFDARFVVPRDKVPAVMDEAMRQCRVRTLSYIPLPANERVDVEYVFHKPWSAFSRYLGHAHSRIQVNMDFPLTVDRILSLACHEGYPGHHVFNTLRDQSVAQSMHRDEWLAQPTFSKQSFVSEASASYAPELAFSREERLRIERDALFPLAGLDAKDAARYLRVQQLIEALHTAQPGIAREYLDGRLEFVRAAEALERETLMEHAETMLLYLNEYRTYMLTYTIGRDQVRSYIEQGSPPDSTRWERYKQLIVQPLWALPALPQ